MMKVSVTKYLNVRVGKPSVNAACYQYLAPGSELVVDGKLYPGDKYDGIDTWLKDEANNYYWSGGVEVPKKPNNAVQNIGRYEHFLSTFSGNGNGVGVALLDSGVNKQHLVLSKFVKKYDSYLEGKALGNIHPHGHLLAGVICSDFTSLHRNESDLYCLRVSDSSNGVDNYAVLYALQDIANPQHMLHKKVDVVNVSLQLSRKILKELQPIIDNLTASGIVVVVAAGEGPDLNRAADLKNVIKVGVFEKNDVSTPHFFPEYDACFLNIPISSYSLDGKELDAKIQDDSAYTAVVSALVAKRIKSKNLSKDGTRFKIIRDFIHSLSGHLEPELKPYKPYQI